MTTKIYNYLLQAIITAIIVVIGMLIMKHQQPPRIVKIDLVAITNHYTQLMMKDSFNNGATNNGANPAIKKISETIKNNLEPAISDYAKKHNVVVIQAQALVSTDTPDITNIIVEQLDRKLK